MSETRVIIIGCGIAGPVLATFLKLKGYHPIVYDRIDSIGEAGISFVYVKFLLVLIVLSIDWV
jgi:salicylate hydroxylase